MMRILHAPVEIAGQVGLIAQAQRELGHESCAYFPMHRFDYRPGPDLSPRRAGTWGRHLHQWRFIASVPSRFEVVHFHFGRSLLGDRWRGLDVQLFRRMGLKVVIQFWGSDVRLHSVDAARNPFHVPDDGMEPTKRELLARWADLTDGHAIFADYSSHAFLAPFFPHIHVVRQAVDTRKLAPRFPFERSEFPVVIHAPSLASLKGTEQVNRAIDNLRRKGLQFEYVELQGANHASVLAALERADLVIDQLLLGSHGVLAVEAMGLGKPVMSFILPDLIETYPEGFPVINVNPDTLESKLKDWILDPERRHVAGVASRRYVERHHDVRVIGADLLNLYPTLP